MMSGLSWKKLRLPIALVMLKAILAGGEPHLIDPVEQGRKGDEHLAPGERSAETEMSTITENEMLIPLPAECTTVCVGKRLGIAIGSHEH